MDIENPFTYPLTTYIFVVVLASISGAIKCINNIANKEKQFSLLQLVSDTLTGGLAGLMAFWICDSMAIYDSKMYLAVTVAGIMGVRAWSEFESIVKTVLKVSNKQ